MHVAVSFNFLSANYFLLENLAECSASHGGGVHLILSFWYLNKRLDFPRKFFPLNGFLQSI